MPLSTTPYRIVVAVDFSELANAALVEALGMMSGRSRPELHVVAVIDDDGGELVPAGDRHATLSQMADRVRERLIADTTARLAASAKEHPGTPKMSAIVHVRVGPIADQIAALAMEIRGDLVVVGTHGRRGMRRLLMGSVAERVVRLAPCPVLVVRPKNFQAMDGLPAIEAACPDCLATRETTDGAQWWCDEHMQRPPTAHTFSWSGRLSDPEPPANHVL